MVTSIIIITTILLVTGARSLPNAAYKQTNANIHGGYPVPIESAPYMASLRLNSTLHFCGAVIIHKRFVLSAAHCIRPKQKYEVAVGTDRLDRVRHLFRVEKIIIHENYDNHSNDFDACLIKLTKNLNFGPKVAKIPLLTTKTIVLNDIYKATGWGATETENLSNILLQTTVPGVSRQWCDREMNHTLTQRMICAGSNGHGSCYGDSGGPLTLGNELVGITSFGRECGKLFVVYTRVSAIKSWIKQTIAYNSK